VSQKRVVFVFGNNFANVNQFSKSFHYWKEGMKFPNKPVQKFPPYLNDVDTLPL